MLCEAYRDDALSQMIYECFRKCQLTIQEVSEEVRISIVSCHTILTEDLGMRHVSEKFVQRLLTDYLLQRANDNDNLRKMSLPMTGYGFIVMMLKPNNSPDTG
jgi:hypothetical protein